MPLLPVCCTPTATQESASKILSRPITSCESTHIQHAYHFGGTTFVFTSTRASLAVFGVVVVWTAALT